MTVTVQSMDEALAHTQRFLTVCFWQEGAELFAACSHPALPAEHWLADCYPAGPRAAEILTRNIEHTKQQLDALGYQGYQRLLEAQPVRTRPAPRGAQ